jgi:hypothetical protein
MSAAIDIEEWRKDRREALLSLDEQKVRAYFRKYNDHEMPSDMELFWGAIHKAITGSTDLPIEFRRASKRYLDERGLKSFDDGDL